MCQVRSFKMPLVYVWEIFQVNYELLLVGLPGNVPCSWGQAVLNYKHACLLSILNFLFFLLYFFCTYITWHCISIYNCTYMEESCFICRNSLKNWESSFNNVQTRPYCAEVQFFRGGYWLLLTSSSTVTWRLQFSLLKSPKLSLRQNLSSQPPR